MMSRDEDLTKLRGELGNIARIWNSGLGGNFNDLLWKEEENFVVRQYNQYGGYWTPEAEKVKRATAKQKKKMKKIVGDFLMEMPSEELLATKGLSFDLRPHDTTDQAICLIKRSKKKNTEETIHCFEGEEIFDIYTLMQEFEIEEMFLQIKRRLGPRIKKIEQDVQMAHQEKMIVGLNFDLLESGTSDHDMTLWG
jgi:hypothetical protein